MVRLTGGFLKEVQTGPADPRHANRNCYWCLALVVPGVGISPVCVEHLGTQHIIPEGREVQGCLAVFKTSQISVSSPLQEHAAVRVISFDNGISQQEAILNVNVGTVVEEDPYATGALADDGQLERRGPFVTQRVHLGPELEEEAYKRVSAVMGGHVEWRPAVVALCIYNVTAKLQF